MAKTSNAPTPEECYDLTHALRQAGHQLTEAAIANARNEHNSKLVDRAVVHKLYRRTAIEQALTLLETLSIMPSDFREQHPMHLLHAKQVAERILRTVNGVIDAANEAARDE